MIVIYNLIRVADEGMCQRREVIATYRPLDLTPLPALRSKLEKYGYELEEVYPTIILDREDWDDHIDAELALDGAKVK
jgi:hypothetical protein